jgi:hypothetical protein
MNNRRCKDCDFAQAWNGDLYLCHYNPPVQIRDVRNDIIERWPPVAADDWCGRFEIRHGRREPTAAVAMADVHEDFA